MTDHTCIRSELGHAACGARRIGRQPRAPRPGRAAGPQTAPPTLRGRPRAYI